MNVKAIVAILVSLVAALVPLAVHGVSASTLATVSLVVTGLVQVLTTVAAALQPAPSQAAAKAGLAKAAAVASAVAIGAMLLGGCAWLKANASIAVADVTTLLPLACDIVEATDAANATVICQDLDTAGNVVAELSPIVTTLVNAQGIAKAYPSTAASKAAVAARKKTSAMIDWDGRFREVTPRSERCLNDVTLPGAHCVTLVSE